MIPQTILHLKGDESYGCSGSGGIAKWVWSVEQPVGSQSVFVPSNTFPNPTFEANVAGVYTFHLTVYDQLAGPSCFPAVYEVVVIHDEAIRVELTWGLPGVDYGQECAGVAGLDLHFAHPYATGPDLDGDGEPDPWFDTPFDCWSWNANPNWGSYDPSVSDDPHLVEGCGIETLALDWPENAVYRVGVHWHSGGWYDDTQTLARVRLYIFSQLVFEAEQLLGLGSMWEVCTVEWPSGKVTPVLGPDGQAKVTPAYCNPFYLCP